MANFMKILSAALMSCVQTDIQTDVVYMLYKTGSPQFLMRPKINCSSESSGNDAIRRSPPPPPAARPRNILPLPRAYKANTKHLTERTADAELPGVWVNAVS